MFGNTILTPSSPDDALREWLGEVFGAAEIAPLPGDASARRYFRARRGADSCIAMHSPQSEKPAQFLAVRDFLESRGVRAPRLIAADAGRGFIALEDFGGDDYLSVLSEKNCGELYSAALRALIQMQSFAPPATLPEYGETMLREEMNLFTEWFCARHLQKPLAAAEMKIFDRAADFLIKECMNQPRVFVHRDYHSRNLMHIGGSSPGILDFQDAVIGPAAYDVVSLLRDAYIFWPQKMQDKWREEYRRGAAARTDALELTRDFNVAGAQRGLKVLGIFARLHHRDGKDAYLPEMPRVRRHLLSACAALPELDGLAEIILSAPPR
ncbi:MAG: aminoglycoside phosphotransferase family protein [Gammaproteobacteria bacterium]